MSDDEESLENPDNADGEMPTPPSAIERAERGTDGRWLPGNHAAGEHLFKPGQSGNPKGPTSMKQFTAKLRDVLEKNDGEMVQALVNVACQRALRGDFRYFKEIVERIEGKVADRLAVNADREIRTFTEAEEREARRMAALLILPPAELEKYLDAACPEDARPADFPG